MNSKLKLVPHLVDAAQLVARDADLGGIGLDWTTVPAALEGSGRDAWLHLADQFGAQPTRFREADRHAVAAFCTAVEMEAAARDALREHGVLVPGRSESDRGRPVRSPAWAMWRDAQTALRQWGRELGLSPAGRRSLAVADLPDDTREGNPFAPH